MHSKRSSKIKRKKISIFTILILTVAALGDVLSWSVVYAFCTPFMMVNFVPHIQIHLQFLGLSQKYVSFVWLIGPLSGIFAQTIFGSLSDKTYVKILGGSRKPYLIIGTLSIIVSLLLFSHADWIASVVLPFDYSYYVQPLSIVIGIVSFVICANSINCVMIAIRALMVDIVPTNQQNFANACYSCFAGIGSTIGFGLGVVPFTEFFPFFNMQLKPLCIVLVICIFVTVGLTVIFIVERKKKVKNGNTPTGVNGNGVVNFHDSVSSVKYNYISAADLIRIKESSVKNLREFLYKIKATSFKSNQAMMKDKRKLFPSSTFASNKRKSKKYSRKVEKEKLLKKKEIVKNEEESIFKLMREINIAFWQAYLIQFTTFFGKFSLFIYCTDFVGRQIFNGDPDNHPLLYKQGVRFGSLCLCVYSAVNCVYSLILQIAFKNIGVRLKVLWIFGQSVQTVCLFSFAFMKSKWLCLVVIGFLGITESTCNCIPFSIVAASLNEDRKFGKAKAIFSALFNTCLCLPQILCALVGFPLVYLSTKFHLPIGIVIATSSLISFVGIILLVVYSSVPHELKEKERSFYQIFCCKQKPMLKTNNIVESTYFVDKGMENQKSAFC